MTCQDCEDIQTDWEDPDRGVTPPPIAYVRVGVANVGILACRDHARMLIERLRAAEGAIRRLEREQGL